MAGSCRNSHGGRSFCRSGPHPPQSGYEIDILELLDCWPGERNRSVVDRPVTATTQPQVVRPAVEGDTKPSNYLALSLLNLLCCCWCIGCVALMTSLQVDSAWNRGDQRGAQSASKQAKTWNIAGIVCGSIAYAIVIAFIIVSVIVGGSSDDDEEEEN